MPKHLELHPSRYTAVNGKIECHVEQLSPGHDDHWLITVNLRKDASTIVNVVSLHVAGGYDKAVDELESQLAEVIGD